MLDVFKTVLLLSALGSAVIIVLLLLKPITARRFSARRQYFIWLIALICMIFPIWKVIPAGGAQYFAPQIIERVSEPTSRLSAADDAGTAATPEENAEIAAADGIGICGAAAYIWLAGMCAFLAAAVGSYCRFLWRKKRSSVGVVENAAFEEVRRELGIKRKIKLRILNDNDSPMLVGVIFPVIYIPPGNADTEKMIFRHELTHYKHGDLLYKRLALLVNAAHWFNPLAYILSANVSRACEMYCDMSVVKNFTDEERRLYMEAILRTAERGQENV